MVLPGVHGNAAVVRTLAPAIRERPDIADGHILVIRVADLSDGRHAILRDFAGFARRQLYQRVFAFLGHQLRRTAGGALPSCAPLPGLSSMFMDGGAGPEMFFSRQRYCRPGCPHPGAADHFLPHFNPSGLQNIPPSLRRRKLNRAMRAERLGSYSMVSTVRGNANLVAT